MRVLMGATTGHYKPIGLPGEADSVIGFAFGTSTGPGSVNATLANLALASGYDREIPVLLEATLNAARQPESPKPDLVIEGEISNARGQGMGADGVLEIAKHYLDTHNLCRPLLIGQAFHIGRVAWQAQKRQMDPIVPRGLPRVFDPTSEEQPWTRSRSNWIPRELVGLVYVGMPSRLQQFVGAKILHSNC